MTVRRNIFLSLILGLVALVFAPQHLAAQNGYDKDYDAVFAQLITPPETEEKKDVSIKFSIRSKPKLPKFLRIKAKHVEEVAHRKLTVLKDTFLSDDLARRTKVLIDEESFLSSGLNHGVDVDTAKMAGFEMEKGHMKLGGGYMWGEESPIFVHNKLSEGFVVGGQYTNNKWNLQLSIVSTGYDFGTVNFGGKTEHNAIFGANYAMNDKVGLSASLRFQNKDRVNDSNNAVILMMGTRIEF